MGAFSCPACCLTPRAVARRTLRFFGHSDGNGYPGHVYTAFPMQTSPGVFSETALQRYDFVLAQCAQVRHYDGPWDLSLTGPRRSS